MIQANLLDSISETRYLSAENCAVYRAVMRVFFLEYQKMHYHMGSRTPCANAAGKAAACTAPTAC